MSHNVEETPKVVIGLLIYNGAEYVAETLDSILNQTFTNFKVIIGDNQSTDSTEDICRYYADKDGRISYIRHPENLGASGNHNALFQPGEAPYFKWASHDDLIQPEYLEKCIKILDENPSIGVVHSRSYTIDEKGNQLGNLDFEVRLNHSQPSQRFWRLLWGGYLPEVHGVMRSSLIRNTQLFRGFPGDDRSFLADMILQADVGYVEEYLFSRRDHSDAYCRLQDWQARQNFFNPKAKQSQNLTGLIKFKEYLSDIYRYPMPWSEKLACVQMLAKWGFHRGLESVTGSGEVFGRQRRQDFSLANSTSLPPVPRS